MAAVLQVEFDRKRVLKMSKKYSGNSAFQQFWTIAQACLDDVFENKGTLVVVVGPEKITLVQREEAQEL